MSPGILLLVGLGRIVDDLGAGGHAEPRTAGLREWALLQGDLEAFLVDAGQVSGRGPGSGDSVRVRLSSKKPSMSIIVVRASHIRRLSVVDGTLVMTGPK